MVGDRTAVRDDDDPRGRYSRVSGVLLGPDGALLAAAEIRFAGSRAYTRRLVEPFLTTTPLDDLARWFPSARELAPKSPPADRSPTGDFRLQTAAFVAKMLSAELVTHEKYHRVQP